MRLGPDRDGGYVVCEKDVLASDYLISLGVSDDWGFESDFLARKDMPLTAYDGSVGARVFFLRFLRAFFKLHKPWHVIVRLRILLSYLLFFNNQLSHNLIKIIAKL